MDKTKYEKLDFNHDINTINSDHFPENFTLHWHNYVEIIAFPEQANNEHKPKVHIQQATYQLNPGDIVLIWPGELHEILENTNKELIGVQFPSTLITELADFASFQNKLRSIHIIRLNDNPDLAQNVITYLEHMLSVEKKENAFHGVEIRIHLYEMFMTLCQHINIVSSSGLTKSMDKMSLACNFITENCNQPLTLDDVAAHLGFSPCYFSRVFKQTTGVNFVEYMALQRVRRAESLLADSNLSITEVAYRSGFKSISTFNRVFRQTKGCPPSDYRHYFDGSIR